MHLLCAAFVTLGAGRKSDRAFPVGSFHAETAARRFKRRDLTMSGSDQQAAFNPLLELDLRHLRCPMPVLRTRKQLNVMRAGELVRVSCTDPLAGIDIPHFVHQSGHRLLEHTIVDDVQVFTIRKA